LTYFLPDRPQRGGRLLPTDAPTGKQDMSSERPRVLLVDDDATVAEITAYRLELLGYSVQATNSGEAALQAIEQQKPDAVVLDLKLPGIDGIEVTSRLSNDERTSRIPVIAFSSDADLATVQKAFGAGAKDYVVKPYDPVVLEQKLEKLIAAHQN
jgi:CheY-like chemotaxis protein